MAVNNQPIAMLAERLMAENLTLVTAESCTGGLLAATLTAVPGSSNWFEGAFVTYRLSAKTRMVGVAPDLLQREGAVSEPTARAMAEGALTHSDAGVSVAITGVAGPDGGGPLTPVGDVWFGWAIRAPEPRCVQTARHRLPGDRDAVRARAVEVAIDGLLALLGPGGR
ncbi:MAG: CinA family protein [Pseudomonadales bacterium]